MPLGEVPRRRISVFRRRSDQPPELELESLAPELELELESLAPELELDELEEEEESLAPELDELEPPYPPLELESLAPELELELDEPLELDESAADPPELEELLELDDEPDELPPELEELLRLPELRSLPCERSGRC